MKTVKSSPLLNIFSKTKFKNKETPLQKEKERILIDYREKNSLVASYLIKQGFEINFRELKIGDYVVKNIVVE